MDSPLAHRARYRFANLPVVWGSFIGVVIGSLVAGLAYIGVIGGSGSSIDSNLLVFVFCVLLAIRYYCSVVFHTYDPAHSPKVRQLGKGDRIAVFAIHVAIIIGCSLNIAALPVFGGKVAAAIVSGQAFLVGGYWYVTRSVRKIEHVQDERDGPLGDSSRDPFVSTILLYDVLIMIFAPVVFFWQSGLEGRGGGMLIGALAFAFAAEMMIGYRRGLKVLWSETVGSIASWVGANEPVSILHYMGRGGQSGVQQMVIQYTVRSGSEGERIIEEKMVGGTVEYVREISGDDAAILRKSIE